MNLLKMKSRGLIVVLIFNLLISCLIWFGSSNILKAGFQDPIFTSFVDSIPTIVIQDETVVEPINMNTYRSLGDTPLLYIQTDRDYVGVGVIQDGVYLTKKALTVFQNGNIVSQTELPDDLVITPEKMKQFFGYIITWVPVIIALCVMVLLWVFYLTLVGFSSLIGLLIKKNKQMPVHSAWRCSMIAMLVVWTADILFSFFGYTLFATFTYNGYSFPLFQWVTALVLAVILMSLETYIGSKDLTKK